MDNNSSNSNVSQIKTGELPPIEDRKVNESDEQKHSWHWIQLTVACVIKVALSIIAGKLVWECNSKEKLILKVIYTLFAIMFSEIDIIYYAIYRVYMGNKCAA